MSPILGSFGGMAARAYGLFAPSSTATPIVGAYDALATVTVGAGGTSSITFSGIPSTYAHLQIRATLQSNTTNTCYVNYTLNATGGTSYSSHYLYGNGSSAGANAGNGASASTMYLNEFPPNTATNIFGSFILDILDYANLNKYKTTRSIGGNDRNGTGVVAVSSGLFMSTNAVTQIDLTPQSSAGFAQYSTFSLYGVR
jgi:hypothetical protein